MLFWLIPVVAILVIVGAIFVSKWIRSSANDDSLFDDDQDEAPADDGFNVKILLAIPLAAVVIWALLSLTAERGKSIEVYGISAPLIEDTIYT